MKKEIPQTPSISLDFAVLAEELGGMGERAIKDFYLKNWPWLAAIAGGVSALASCAPFPKALANEPTPRAPITQPVEPSAIPTLPPNPTATRSIEENITFAQRLGISFIESNVFNNERVMNELTVGLGVSDLSHNYNLQIDLAQFGQSPTAAVTDYRLQTEGRQPVWQPVFITDKAGTIKAIVLHNFTKLGADSNRVGVFRIENEDFVAYDVSGKLIAGFTNVGSGDPSKIFFQLVGEDNQLYPVLPGGQEKQTEIMRITAQGDSNGGWIYVYEIIKIPQESNQGFSVAGALLPTPTPSRTPKPTATATVTNTPTPPNTPRPPATLSPAEIQKQAVQIAQNMTYGDYAVVPKDLDQGKKQIIHDAIEQAVINAPYGVTADELNAFISNADSQHRDLRKEFDAKYKRFGITFDDMVSQLHLQGPEDLFRNIHSIRPSSSTVNAGSYYDDAGNVWLQKEFFNNPPPSRPPFIDVIKECIGTQIYENTRDIVFERVNAKKIPPPLNVQGHIPEAVSFAVQAYVTNQLKNNKGTTFQGMDDLITNSIELAFNGGIIGR